MIYHVPILWEFDLSFSTATQADPEELINVRAQVYDGHCHMGVDLTVMERYHSGFLLVFKHVYNTNAGNGFSNLAILSNRKFRFITTCHS